MDSGSNKVEVVIDGQVIKLTAFESDEYIRNVARYIDKKISEVSKLKSGSSVNAITRWLLVALNIADELFKEREKIPERGIELAQAELEAEKYISEIHKLQEENFMLNEKINELQLEILRVRKEFDDYLEAFGNG